MDDQPKLPEPPVALLHCRHCGKTIPCRQAEYDGHMQRHVWPMCCGEVMGIYRSASPTGKPDNPPY